MKRLVLIAAWLVFLLLDEQRELDRQVEETFSWAQFTYNYSQHRWCVNAQRRDGAQVGGCWKTLSEAEAGILERRSDVRTKQSDLHRHD
jgi:hypothetical protein